MSSSGTPDGEDRLVAEAGAWARVDPDEGTRRQVTEAISRRDVESLSRWFGSRLRFGTAGLRGPEQPGPAGINLVVGRQTARGLVDQLRASGATGPVVIGYDGRHKSRAIAHEMASVALEADFEVHLIDRPAPTPLSAWLMAEKQAAAGVIVTASHNPAADNGIKVYGSDAAQIVPPQDVEIAQAILAAADSELRADVDAPAPAKRGATYPTGLDGELAGASNALGSSPLLHRATSAEDAAYVGWVREQVRPTVPHSPPRIAYTALHGVGFPLASRCLEELLGAEVHAVAAQRDPDPDFPTVEFPNPEEPGATDMLVALAEEIDADLAIANDPDADRCAVAVRHRSGRGWVQLSGDQLGWLLAERAVRSGVDTNDLFVTTVVSSQLLHKMAADRGARFVETLTGFKWLCRPAMEHPELRQRLAYEEALGYAIGAARDKDGIAAAVAAAEFVCRLSESGETVWTVLDDLFVRFGHHRTRNVSIRSTDQPAVPFAPGSVSPTEFSGLEVLEVDRPAADVVRLHLAGGSRAAFRPSGTEPKFKVYLEAVVPHGTAAEAEAEAQLDALEASARAVLA